MALIAGLFRTADLAARVLQDLQLAAIGVCVEDIRVAGRRLHGLELYGREKRYMHERIRSSDAVLVTIRSDSADLVVLRDRLVAAGMDVLETQYANPREYSQYPYGDGVRRDLEEHPPDLTRGDKSRPETTASREALDKDWY